MAMKKYIKPNNKVIELENENLIMASNACDCFAHKGNHSKCSGGCHNSAKLEEEPTIEEISLHNIILDE